LKKKKKVLKFWSLETSLDRTTKLVVVVVVEGDFIENVIRETYMLCLPITYLISIS
jgi:hypothetical protein